MDVDSSHFDLEHGAYDASNALVLPSKRIKAPKTITQSKKKVRILSKKQRKKLEQIVAKRGKKKNRAELLLELQKHQISQDIYDTLTPLVKIQNDGLKKLFAQSAKTKRLKESTNQLKETELEEPWQDGTVDSPSDPDPEDSSSDSDIIGSESESEPIQDHEPEPPELVSDSDQESPTTKKVGREAFDSEDDEVPVRHNYTPRPHCHVKVNRSPEIEAIRAKLPIVPEEQAIMEAINENLVTILAGETGSGKTTQVPQFLYEAGYANAPKLVGITEPRRVAAIAMANRVGKELNLSPQEVSYQIRFEGNTSPKTRIKFMTDGVLLKEMEKDFILSRYSVICIDEAHERSLFTDILIGLLSRVVFIREKRSDPLKLLVMSATLRIEDFTQNKLLFPRIPAVIYVPTRQFPVQIHFSKKTPANYLEAAKKKVLQIHRKLPPGGILLFVTGQEEVKQLCNQLKQSDVSARSFSRLPKAKRKAASNIPVKEFDLDKIKTPKSLNDSESEDEDNEENDEEEEVELEGHEGPKETLHVVPLYSMLPVKEQQKIFAPPPPNSRLCVVTTNVAETSLTIPSVRYVVDSGKVKLKLWDKLTGVQTFHINWASKASAEQRAGRAGRTGPGHCYRLYSAAVFHTEFPEFSEPEIKVRPVEDMVLLMKSMSINRVRRFPYPTHPGDAQLRSAETLLLNLGALEYPRSGSEEVKGHEKVDGTIITSLGKTMAHLPVSPRFARMLAISFSHSVLDYVITLVAALSIKEILLESSEDPSSTNQSKTRWNQIRRKWAGTGSSLLLGDSMVLLRAVGAFEFDGGSPESCLKFGLRFKAMQEIRKLRKQLTTEINLMVRGNEETVVNPAMKPPTEEQSKILRQILLSGFPDRIGRRMAENEIPSGEAKKYRHAYWCGELSDPVFLHSDSVLRGDLPQWIVYQEAFESSGKIYLRGVSGIEPEWILAIAPSLCQMNKPVQDPPPFWDSVTGTVKCYVTASYGKQNWELPLSPIEYPYSADKFKLLAQFFLEGDLFEPLKKFKPKLLSNPSIMTKSWARLQPRTQVLLTKISSKGIQRRSDFVEHWKKEPNLLLQEYLTWLPNQFHVEVQLIWPPLNP